MPRHTRDMIGTGEILDLVRERLATLSQHDLDTIATECAQEARIRLQERAEMSFEEKMEDAGRGHLVRYGYVL